MLIIALLVTKPEDIPKITAKIRELRRFVHYTKQEFWRYFDPGFIIEESQNKNLEKNRPLSKLKYMCILKVG